MSRFIGECPHIDVLTLNTRYLEQHSFVELVHGDTREIVVVDDQRCF